MARESGPVACRRSGRWTLGLLAGLALPCGPASAGEGEGPIPRLETVETPDGRSSIGLPPGWVRKGPPPGANDVADHWVADLDGDPSEYDLYVYVSERPAFARVALAGSMQFLSVGGTVVPGSVKDSAGVWTEERHVPDIGMRIVVRAIEGKGTVYLAEVGFREGKADAMRPAALQMLGSFRALQPWKAADLPETFQRWEVSGCEVWSDAKRTDVERLTREFAECAAMFRKLEATAPALTDPPRLIVCSTTEVYSSFWKDPRITVPPSCFHDAVNRAVAVDLSASRPDGFLGTFRRTVCSLLVVRWAGGVVPAWLHLGLSGHLVSGMTNEGKFAQSTASLVGKAKGAALRANRPLTAVLDVLEEPVAQIDEFASEAYAWHFFFRFGRGQKTWGDAYRKWMDTLRRTGDVRAARKAFDGVDHEKLHREFLDWANGWKEGKPLGG